MSKELAYPRRKKQDWSSYLYILPMLAIVIFFWIIPILISVVLSFTQYNALSTPHFNGVENYKALFEDRIFRQSLINTLIFVITVVPGQTILAFLTASWIDRKGKNPATQFVRWAMFIPSLASVSIVGIVCRILLNNPSSPLNTLFSLFGLNPSLLLGSEKAAFPTLIVIEILIGSGYYMVIYLAALLDIPRSYYEAAKIDGASQFQIFWKITFPLMRPMTLLVILLGSISAFQSFDLVYTMTGGGPGRSTTMTAMVYLYLYSFKYSKIGFAMAIGNVLILVIAVLTIVQRRLAGRKENILY